jgi:hypothetical protein
MPRVTAACPLALIADGNALAMCLAYGPADGDTFRVPPPWQDAAGHLYSAASWEASETWLASLSAPVTRPAWDVDELIDMDAATRAQAALILTAEALAADPARIVAIVGMDGPAALAAMGLVPVPMDEASA